ncbi:MAG: LamG-like jellyroll fold domain-containing protein [Puniceicoccaceae bacterium]
MIISSTPFPLQCKRTLAFLLSLIPLALSGNAESTPPDLFDVTTFGANGQDETDDTRAIAEAIDAARLNGGGTVYFPAGIYNVSPPGTAVVSLYHKQDGAWKLLKDGVKYKYSVEQWHFGLDDPENTAGEDNHYYLNLRNGKVSRKIAANWVTQGELAKGKGEGWISASGTPADSDGIDGIYYLEYRVSFDNLNGAVFLLTQEHNNITFKGEGKVLSSISFKAWSGQDPMNYSVDVDSKSILYSAIPKSVTGRHFRGSLFVLDPPIGKGPYSNIHWIGLEMRGNTTANGKHGWYNPYQDLEEWDISNKCIVFTFAHAELYNISVRDCSVNGWRGEILYKGGEKYAEILIENCDIFESNASAVSMGANMTMRNCKIWNVVNGIENFSMDGHFSEIYGTSISNNIGPFGIVYLGTEKAHLLVENCELSNASQAGVFLSDFASNVTIRNNIVKDTKVGIYFTHLNQYKLPPVYNNVSIHNNSFEAHSRNMEYGVLSYVSKGEGRDWTVRENTFQGFDGNRVKYVISDAYSGSREVHNVSVENNVIYQSKLFSGSGILPWFMNNQRIDYKPMSIWHYKAEPHNIFIPEIHCRITDVKYDGYILNLNEVGRYPTGHRILIEGSGIRSPELIPSDWNNFSRGYTLYKGASIILEKGADGKMFVADYKPPSTTEEYVVNKGTELLARGYEELTLAPNALTVYETFSGIAINVPVTLHVNKHVRFANSATIKTPNGGTYDPDESSPLTVIKDANGILTFVDAGNDSTTGTLLEPLHMWSFDTAEGGYFPDLGQSPLPIASESAVETMGIGPASRGISFSGAHQGLQIPDSETINMGDQATYTISLWIRPVAATLSNTSIIYEQGGYWRGLNLILDRGFLQANGWNRPSGESNWSGTTLNAGRLLVDEWNHIALVLDGNDALASDSLHLYLNGVHVASGNGARIWAQHDSNGIGQVRGTTVYLGRQVRSLHPLQAEIDDLSIWDAALSGEELNDLILQTLESQPN